MDSHRTWELLLLGVVPIVEHSRMDFMWASGDLPVLAVDDLLHLPSKEELENLYEERFGSKMANFKRKRLGRQFWHDKFDTFRREHLKDPKSGNLGRRRCWHGKPGLSPRAAKQWAKGSSALDSLNRSAWVGESDGSRRSSRRRRSSSSSRVRHTPPLTSF